MRKDFKTRWTKVDRTDDAKWVEVEELAKKVPIPHTVDRRLETLIVSNDATGEHLGYIQMIPWPAVVTSWLRPGADTICAINQTHQEMVSRGFMVTACPLDSKFHPHMHRLGFTSSGLELFYSSDDHGQD